MWTTAFTCSEEPWGVHLPDIKVGGELADHHLYQLDMRAGEDKAVWSIKNQEGNSPGRRYGHVMAYIHPFLVVFGGNTGIEPVNDVWTFSLN